MALASPVRHERGGDREDYKGRKECDRLQTTRLWLVGINEIANTALARTTSEEKKRFDSINSKECLGSALIKVASFINEKRYMMNTTFYTIVAVNDLHTEW